MPSNPDFIPSIKPVDYGKIIDYFRTSNDVDNSIVDRLNIEQMFVLIDGILPIEACLYYQVLPLFLEGSRLNLGMVSPGDTAATDYVRRIVSYLNYSLVTHQISSEALRSSLTAYLRHSDETAAKAKAAAKPSAASRRAKRLSDRENAPQNFDASAQPTLVVDSPDDLDPSDLNFADNAAIAPEVDWEADNVDTITIGLFDEGAPDFQTADSPSPSAPSTDHAQADPTPHSDPASEGLRSDPVDVIDETSSPATAPEGIASDVIEDIAAEASIPDIPHLEDDNEEESEPPLSSLADANNSEPAAPASAEEILQRSSDVDASAVNESPANESATTHDAPASQSSRQRFLRYRSEKNAPSLSTSSAPSRASAPSGLLRSPIQLELDPISTSLEPSELAKLPATALLTELLVRTLDQGIGRLYFECHERSGRILWSEDGVLQSVIEGLSSEKFIQLIEALKALTKLPIHPSDKPIQVELERLYQHERILLRFRFVPTPLGEEATLQVLRGAALRFYQRQQLSKLSRDAITTAQALQNKVNALRDRLLATTDMSDNHSNVLPTLAAMIDQIEGQLDDLEDMMNGG
ncbi:MAG: hypothetical protein VKL39_16940 [Leptolyngbyaceae bacterium]|nr:hypothetical protein [Leptolyngbyaceae bacterium]